MKCPKCMKELKTNNKITTNNIKIYVVKCSCGYKDTIIEHLENQ